MKKFAVSRPNVPGMEEYTPVVIGFSDEQTEACHLPLGKLEPLQLQGFIADINGGVCSGSLPELEAAQVLAGIGKHLCGRLRGIATKYDVLYIEWHTSLDKSDANAIRLAETVRGLKLPKETHR